MFFTGVRLKFDFFLLEAKIYGFAACGQSSVGLKCIFFVCLMKIDQFTQKSAREKLKMIFSFKFTRLPKFSGVRKFQLLFCKSLFSYIKPLKMVVSNFQQ